VTDNVDEREFHVNGKLQPRREPHNLRTLQRNALLYTYIETGY
jgi:hypothetical protein